MTATLKIHERVVTSDMYAFRNVEFPISTDPFLATEYVDDYVEISSRKKSTFFARAKGHSMSGAGIFSGDLLALDSSIPACHGHVVLVSVYGGYTLKRLHSMNGSLSLLPENNEFKPIHLPHGLDYKILGVVVFNIHRTV